MKSAVLNAKAYIHGGSLYPEIVGAVYFEEISNGSVVFVTVNGLPEFSRGGTAPIGPFGFHIHEKGDCSLGTSTDPFPKTGTHYNPSAQPHGNHAGDLPVLFSMNGRAKMSFYTDKFRPRDIIGRSIVIHQSPDDFRTEPSGNSGTKIACGTILKD